MPSDKHVIWFGCIFFFAVVAARVSAFWTMPTMRKSTMEFRLCGIKQLKWHGKAIKSSMICMRCALLPFCFSFAGTRALFHILGSPYPAHIWNDLHPFFSYPVSHIFATHNIFCFFFPCLFAFIRLAFTPFTGKTCILILLTGIHYPCALMNASIVGWDVGRRAIFISVSAARACNTHPSALWSLLNDWKITMFLLQNWTQI